MERFDAFTITIMTLNRQVQKIKDQEMARFGLKGSHVMPIYFLGQNEDGLTAAELSRLCHEDKAAISRTLGKLETADVVAPVPSTPGRRDYRVRRYLTEHGKDIFLQMTSRISNAVSSGSDGLSSRQRWNLHQALQTISANLENLSEENISNTENSSNT